MKVLKKGIALLMATVATLSCVGCSGTPSSDDGGIVVNKAKSQLYVAYFNEGYGSDWLTAAAKRFEEMYEDYSFEDGKHGVQVVPLPQAMADLSPVMKAGGQASVFFCENFDLSSYNSQGVLADITSAVTTPLNESYGVDKTGKALPGYEGETKSIADKYTTEEVASHSRMVGENRVYEAVPYIDAVQGIFTYDADVFEKFSLYFKADNTIGAKKASGNLGLGPDGTANTADDGLPRTLAEMRTLVSKMTSYGVVPFNTIGGNSLYLDDSQLSMLMASLGSERIEELKKGEGTVPDYIADLKAVTETSYPAPVSKTYEAKNAFATLKQSATVYEIVSFYRDLVHQFDGKAFRWVDLVNKLYSQYSAQRDFYYGNELARDYGILIDGSWWLIEAEPKVQEYEQDNMSGKTRYDRNLLYMPYPKATEAIWESTKGENVVYTSYLTGVAIRQGLNESQQLLAETFLRFYCTDESLVEYNTIVSQKRGLTYELTDEQYEELVPFARSMYSAAVGDADRGYGTYKLKSCASKENFALSNMESLTRGSIFFTNASNSASMLNAFYNNRALKLSDYFIGLCS